MEVPAGQAQHRAMTPNLLFRNALMVLGLMIATPLVVAKAHGGGLRLTVRVFDYVNVPAEAISEIETSAKRVLGQAGVSVEFVECYHGGVEAGLPPCTSPPGPGGSHSADLRAETGGQARATRVCRHDARRRRSLPDSVHRSGTAKS